MFATRFSWGVALVTCLGCFQAKYPVDEHEQAVKNVSNLSQANIPAQEIDFAVKYSLGRSEVWLTKIVVSNDNELARLLPVTPTLHGAILLEIQGNCSRTKVADAIHSLGTELYGLSWTIDHVPLGAFFDTGPLRGLKFLELRGRPSVHYDGDFKWIKQLRKLRVLNISACPVTDSDLAAKPPLDSLRDVSLAQTLVTSVASLSENKAMRTLTLRGSPITDEGLRAITNMPELEYLDISQTRVTKACISETLVHCRNLFKLNMEGVDVSADELSPLQSLPEIAGIEFTKNGSPEVLEPRTPEVDVP